MAKSRVEEKTLGYFSLIITDPSKTLQQLYSELGINPDLQGLVLTYISQKNDGEIGEVGIPKKYNAKKSCTDVLNLLEMHLFDKTVLGISGKFKPQEVKVTTRLEAEKKFSRPENEFNSAKDWEIVAISNRDYDMEYVRDMNKSFKKTLGAPDSIVSMPEAVINMGRMSLPNSSETPVIDRLKGAIFKISLSSEAEKLENKPKELKIFKNTNLVKFISNYSSELSSEEITDLKNHIMDKDQITFLTDESRSKIETILNKKIEKPFLERQKENTNPGLSANATVETSIPMPLPPSTQVTGKQHTLFGSKSIFVKTKIEEVEEVEKMLLKKSK